MDPVAEDADCLVFVEVLRSRAGARHTGGMIIEAKQAKLVEVAQTYLQEHDWPRYWRIDVVVELTRGRKLERVTVIQNAVGG